MTVFLLMHSKLDATWNSGQQPNMWLPLQENTDYKGFFFFFKFLKKIKYSAHALDTSIM